MYRVLIALVGTVCPIIAAAVQFSGSQTGPTTWTYNLTYDPLDNYSICQADTTITVSGLTGVTTAGGPTSTDMPAPALVAVQLAWTPQVLNGGSTVVWTHVGPGTGNFSIPIHVNGFTISSNAKSGSAPFVTSGFALDAGCAPPTPRDISGVVAGPVAAPTSQLTPIPTLSLLSLVVLAIALAMTAAFFMRRKS